MRLICSILIVCSVAVAVFPAGDVYKLKGRLGFGDEGESIELYRFVDNETKLLLIGQKTVQLWDIDSGTMIKAMPHQIPQFMSAGFTSTYLLLGLPKLLRWRPVFIDPSGTWMMTAEAVGTNQYRSAVVRQIPDLKIIAQLDIPNVSIDYVTYDENRDEILAQGVSDKLGGFASWNRSDFKIKETFTVPNYKWHQTIRDDKKAIVGAGDTKIVWTGPGTKQGETLTLRDVQTGAIEKEYSAEGLKPQTSYLETTVSSDESRLISKRDDRIFVWEIDGDGKPKFEISRPAPKVDFSLKRIIDRRYIVIKFGEELRIYDAVSDGKPILVVSPKTKDDDFDLLTLVKERFAIVKAKSKIQVYDVTQGSKLNFELVSENPKDSMDYRDYNERDMLLAVSDDRKVRVVRLDGSGSSIFELTRDSEKERFNSVAFFDDKGLLSISRENNSEKKPPRTEFYEMPSGKLSFDAGIVAGGDSKFTPGDRLIYQTNIGSFEVWNMQMRRSFRVFLDTYTEETYDVSTGQTSQGETRNTEFAEFSPDYRQILRYGEKITAVFDGETGQLIQQLFDPTNAKYNKKNQLTHSNLGTAGWIRNGKVLFAFDSRGLSDKRRNVLFWSE